MRKFRGSQMADAPVLIYQLCNEVACPGLPCRFCKGGLTKVGSTGFTS